MIIGPGSRLRCRCEPGAYSEWPRLGIDDPEILLGHVKAARNSVLRCTRGIAKAYPTLVAQHKLRLRSYQGHSMENISAVTEFGGTAFQETFAGGNLIEEPCDFDNRSDGPRRRPDCPGTRVVIDSTCMGSIGSFTAEREPCNRGDRSECLSTESMGEDLAEIIEGPNLTCRVPLYRQGKFRSGYPTAIVAHTNYSDPTFFKFDMNRVCLRINRVFHQFFDHRGRPLDDLARRDLANECIGK